jgi:predicted nucleic acid-binding Zn ribbon protein
MADMPLDPVYRKMIATFRRSPNWDSQLDLQVLQKLWPALAGPELAAVTKVVALQGATVVINVPDQIWRRQLMRMKTRLLAKLNEPWPSPFITEIAFTHEDYRN